MSRPVLERYIAATLFFLVILVFSFAVRDEQRIRAAHEATQAGRRLARQVKAPQVLLQQTGALTQAR